MVPDPACLGQTGGHYTNFNHSPGLPIYSQGLLLHNRVSLSSLNLTLIIANPLSLGNVSSYVNILTNPNAPYGLPNVSTDYTFSTIGDAQCDSAFKIINGLL
jgi:hypothetical protein